MEVTAAGERRAWRSRCGLYRILAIRRAQQPAATYYAQRICPARGGRAAYWRVIGCYRTRAEAEQACEADLQRAREESS